MIALCSRAFHMYGQSFYVRNGKHEVALVVCGITDFLISEPFD